jgi:hypothetical protein
MDLHIHPPASDLGAAGLSLGVVDVVPEGVDSEEDIAQIKDDAGTELAK